MIKTPRQELKQLEEELKQQVPEPMHSMLEKESREDAIQKHKSRKLKETVIVPPTCTGKWPSTYCTGLHIQLHTQNLTMPLIEIIYMYLHACLIYLQISEAELQTLVQNQRLQSTTSTRSTGTRSYKCRKCGQPKRGHVCPNDNDNDET